MMDVQKTKAPAKRRNQNGFTMVEITVMAAIISIVTAFGILGITRARASVRLSGAAREYATYIEKARMHSIRSHADDASERASVTIADAKTSYNVTLDLDGNGTMDTRTIPLPSDVSFETVETIAFDWRGRTWSTVNGITTSNAQVSIRLTNGTDSASVDVTGSGDITIDSRVFDDSVPNVNLRVGDLAAGATPIPTPDAGATPPVVDGTLPTPTPTPTPVSGGGGSVPTPTPTPGNNGNGNGNGHAQATPTPTPSPTATPTPTPQPCSLTTDPTSVTLALEGTKTIKVSHNGTSSITISGSSSKASDLQVTPGGSQTVAAGGSVTFTLKSKKSIGVYNVTFSSGCGTKTVPVVVLL